MRHRTGPPLGIVAGAEVTGKRKRRVRCPTAGVPAAFPLLSLRLAAPLGPADQRPVAVLVNWLDRPSIGLVDPRGQRVAYNLQD